MIYTALVMITISQIFERLEHQQKILHLLSLGRHETDMLPLGQLNLLGHQLQIGSGNFEFRTGALLYSQFR